MNICILRGKDATGAMQDPSFEAEWDRLYEQCRWATAFQAFGYIATWYRSYRESFEPVLVVGSTGSRITALLPLAVGRTDPRLVYAGANQAEYQTWLAEESEASEFIVAALATLRRAFRGHPLTIRYIPPGVPLGRLRSGGALGTFCSVIPHTRQIWDFSAPAADETAEVHDTSKRKLKNLAKLGALRFQRVTSLEDFERQLPDIGLYYDLRMGALYDTTPFATDEAKTVFHRDLFRIPGLLHVTTLVVGDRLVSAQVALCSRDTVHLGFWSQSPFMLKYSPGKLHLSMLVALAKSEGWRALDLTPGAAAYKDRYAIREEVVHELFAYPNRRSCFASRCRRAVKATASRAAHSPRVERARRRLGELLTRTGLRRAAADEGHEDCALLHMDAARARELAGCGAERLDRIADLLAYRSGPSAASRQAFLSASQERFARGDHSWSTADDEGLRWCAWFGDRKAGTVLEGTRPSRSLPVDAVVCYEMLASPPDASEERYQGWLRQALASAARTSRAEHVYASVPRDDARCRRSLQALGFVEEAAMADDEARPEEMPAATVGGAPAA